jgi:hypothetical protein
VLGGGGGGARVRFLRTDSGCKTEAKVKPELMGLFMALPLLGYL